MICSPTGPFFRTGPRPVALYAVSENVRAWPGGTGGYKLALNYASTFRPQQLADFFSKHGSKLSDGTYGITFKQMLYGIRAQWCVLDAFGILAAFLECE